jgi:ribonuclease HII
MPPKKSEPLNTCFSSLNKFEIGIDEAGRGPLFGRLYVAATVLPKESGFHHDWMKDSKRFSSDKKIREVSDYIKTNAIAWSIQYVEPVVIDEINIRQAVLRTMRLCAQEILKQLSSADPHNDVCLLVDGNDFSAFTTYHEPSESLVEIPHHTIEGGDNLYTCIAAASILAKVARDDYIDDLCKTRPELVERYGIDKNKGYGTKRHMDGIVEYGITDLHRKSYKPCKV